MHSLWQPTLQLLQRGPDSFDLPPKLRLGVGAQGQVPLISADRSRPVAGERGEAALFPEEGGEIRSPEPRIPNQGFGLVKFRQPKDDLLIIQLGTWVRDLAPNSSFVLQRAVDPNLDGVCSSGAWLTLGEGLVPQALNTDATGTAREDLFRNVSAFPVGSQFDIHFQVVDAAAQSVVVLASGCYQFTINQ
jgi:hypothetical protein